MFNPDLRESVEYTCSSADLSLSMGVPWNVPSKFRKTSLSDLVSMKFLENAPVTFDLYHRFFLIKGQNCYAVVSSSLLKAKGFPSGVEKIPLSPGIIYSMGSNGCKAIEKVNGCSTVESKEAILL